MKLKVAIATSSPEKINGINDAISRFFNIEEKDIELHSKAIKSGVSEQPFGDEIYVGALNRILAIKNEFQDMNLYVSCEAGIETAFAQYFNVQVVCIFDTKSQMFFWGKSAGWSIPAKDIEMIRKGNLDSYLRGKGISSIEQLLGASNSRSLAIAQATELALASGKL